MNYLATPWGNGVGKFFKQVFLGNSVLIIPWFKIVCHQTGFVYNEKMVYMKPVTVDFEF